MPLADCQTSVDSLVRDRDAVITTAQRDAAIDAAVAQYSVDHPRSIVNDVVSAGGALLDLPPEWTDDAVLTGAEYPIGSLSPAFALGDVSFYATPTGTQLRLPVELDAGVSVRITFTGAHRLDADSDTIRPGHRQAVAALAASMLCGQLASYYAGESESSISADTVDRKNKSDLWRARSRDLAAEYSKVVGPAPSARKQGASATVQLTRPNSLGGRRMFHPPGNWPVS